jgi:hypothetical protein
MNIILITLVIQIFLIAGIILYFILEILKIQNRSSQADENVHGWDKTTTILIVLTICLLLGSFVAPKLITSRFLGVTINESTAKAGDTIGGLMNPFIAIAGVITTGLAFYIQYKANEQGKRQFREQLNVQKFESQFYEMLKLHRDNVSEMKISGYDFEENGKLVRFERTVDGRKIFVSMKKELECILEIYVNSGSQLDHQAFQKCYRLFFFGLEEFEKQYPNETSLHLLFKRARKQHRSPDNTIKDNKERKRFKQTQQRGQRFVSHYVKLNFNYKPFSGHSSRMGHYFRHLYLTVKSIVNSNVVKDYHEKMKYLKLLRAQLSNHEQILLFYNWLGGFGENWENEKNEFFTEYRMIHNLWYRNLYECKLIEDKIDELRNKPVKNRDPDVKMFEIDEEKDD